jgi:multiple sugar transport system substrate-binding protein
MLIIYIFPTYNIADRTMGQAVKIYFADNISPAHSKLIKLFNEKYKGQIEVVPLDLPFGKFSTNDRKELLARYFRSKSNRIDVFSVDQIWVPRFARWAIPLEEYFPDSFKTQTLKNALKTCYCNDTLISIPLYIDIALMYYRRDLIDRLSNSKQIEAELKKSITWEDLIALNKKFPKNPLFVFQADDFEGVICIYAEILANMHGKIMEGDSLLLKTPEAEKALQYLVDLVNKYKIAPPNVLRFKEDDSYNYYLENNGVFLRGWTGLFKNNKVGSNYLSLNNSIEEVPTPHLKGSKPTSVFGGWNLMVSKYSSKVPEAICFIKFLMSTEAQKILFEEGGYIPINKSVLYDSLYTVKNPELLLYADLLKNGMYRPFSEQYTNVSDVLSYYVNLAIRGSVSPHEALYKAYNNLNSKSILLK